MNDQHSPQPEHAGDNIDPAIWRGLTQRRVSRRNVLRSAGAGAGALGIGAFLAACGVKGATVANHNNQASGPGSAEWWAKQKLHHTVNFGNWPLYVDVLGGKHPSLERFTQTTGITVNYTEPITNNSPALGDLINYGWLTPLDQSAMPNFRKYAGPLVKNPSWDRGNKYTMAWQSGWTAIGYNGSVIQNPTSVSILFDKKYAGKVGMMSDPQELGSVGLLAIGVEPATSTESEWARAAKKLQQQKSDGIVRAYYGQEYITALKNGDTVVSQAWSGDIFQADLNSKYKDLRFLIPGEGGMSWTDNMCIPMNAQNPKDAMTLMDYYYNPDVQAVVEYYNDYVCPVPSAKQVLLNPTGWAEQTLKAMHPSIGLPYSTTANAPTVFPTPAYVHNSRSYYQYKSQEELTAWNNLFLPITQGS